MLSNADLKKEHKKFKVSYKQGSLLHEDTWPRVQQSLRGGAVIKASPKEDLHQQLAKYLDFAYLGTDGELIAYLDAKLEELRQSRVQKDDSNKRGFQLSGTPFFENLSSDAQQQMVTGYQQILTTESTQRSRKQVRKREAKFADKAFWIQKIDQERAAGGSARLTDGDIAFWLGLKPWKVTRTLHPPPEVARGLSIPKPKQPATVKAVLEAVKEIGFRHLSIDKVVQKVRSEDTTTPTYRTVRLILRH